jgi:hypothetical protein
MSYLLEQSAEIIFTDETLIFWSLLIVDEDEVVVPEVDVALDDRLWASIVPVTSTLWPTCLLRSLSEPSSL